MEDQVALTVALFFGVSSGVAMFACLLGLLANIVDWLFKPSTKFLHYLANIFWVIGASSMLVTGIALVIVSRMAS